jgi:hypothetical protein
MQLIKLIQSCPVGFLALGLFWVTGSHLAQALPGQSVRDETAWIQAHPTLQPVEGETLRVRKSDSAAQRFEFEASLAAPGELAPSRSTGRIRSESIELFDAINGMSMERLEETLRIIYGVDIYQDYAQATVVYDYPQPLNTLDIGVHLTPLLLAQQGEVRLGERYGYWLEIVHNPDGKAYNGQVVVFLPEDLDALKTKLQPVPSRASK